MLHLPKVLGLDERCLGMPVLRAFVLVTLDAACRSALYRLQAAPRYLGW